MTESTASLQRPQNVTLALRILWFFLIANVIFAVAMYAMNWDALVANAVAKEAAAGGVSESDLDRVSDIGASSKTIAMIVLVAIPIVVWVLCGLFYSMIGKGKNWARILFLVLSILGFAWLGYEISKEGVPSFEANWFGAYNIWKYLSTLGSLVALVLLFSPSANPWFQRRSH